MSSEETFRRIMTQSWAGLEAEAPTGDGRLRVARLPVDVVHGPLAVGIDYEGRRHMLIPIPSDRRLRAGLDGPGLRLRKRPLEDEETYQYYADLSCLRDDLGDLFTELCVEIMSAAEDLPENPVKALYRVLDRWRSLFRAHGTLLGPEQLAGLFGELIVLHRLLELDPSAHRLWVGPEGHRHDFLGATDAVEVKTSTADEGRRARIHGLDQLEAPTGGQLSLVWLGLRRAAGPTVGDTVPGLVDRLLRLCDDESALLDSLARVGYRVPDAERYQDVRFVVREERWYRVGPEFPGLTAQALTAAGVPVSVLDVSYTVDLSGAVPLPMEPSEATRTVESLLQGAA
ncbi:PD-(D/E)XK motif protein [Streptomyces sp. NRRL F-2747]|uniref:PD-(D/E)XK motif protein n=1 Tax=Streptomyces sp. NRRL F-2747 TaxID=1463843 RepID=UPI000AC436E5|nr:PD-(D/E)XK motif protein [Streptomyces sp. NRRL F-2747]